MHPQQQQAIDNFDAILEGLTILKGHLINNDDDGAHEAITVTMMMSAERFGMESPTMKQFFPVLDNIKRRIDGMLLPDALRQTELFENQIREIQTLIRNG
jgi:hypothetical protein